MEKAGLNITPKKFKELSKLAENIRGDLLIKKENYLLKKK